MNRTAATLPDERVVTGTDEAGRDETRRELVNMAIEATGDKLAPLLADLVLEQGDDADWPVLRGAMEAILRRWNVMTSDELRVASRPDARRVSGLYTTRRPRSDPRPYRTLLRSVTPLRGSCDCPDFLHGSLGVCKHLFVVLKDLSEKPRRWRGAMETEASPLPSDRLSWNPIRPLRGSGDALDRLALLPGKQASEQRRWFAKNGLDARPLEHTYANDDTLRLRQVEQLDKLARRGSKNAPADPAVRALLTIEGNHLRRQLSLAKDASRLRRDLFSLKRKLYPYQCEGFEKFLACGRLLLADDMGLGKTAQAIAIAHALFRGTRVQRGLIIVPASLKSQWAREWRRFSDTPVDVVFGSPETRAAQYRTRRGFLIANYEQVQRDLAWMAAWKPDLVILDEAQRIKNWATKTALCVKQLDPPYRLVLTGTPMENRLPELASIHEWVDERALQPKWRLEPWHGVFADGIRGVVGARNLDVLRERLRPTMLRRQRSEILHQLPERTDTWVPVELTEEQRAKSTTRCSSRSSVSPTSKNADRSRRRSSCASCSCSRRSASSRTAWPSSTSRASGPASPA